MKLFVYIKNRTTPVILETTVGIAAKILNSFKLGNGSSIIGPNCYIPEENIDYLWLEEE